MTTLCLSTHANNHFEGQQQAQHLFVATVKGIVKLEREKNDSWKYVGTILNNNHISALLFEPKQQGLFAALLPGKLMYSPDMGSTWEERSDGIAESGIYSLRHNQESEGMVIYAGTQPVSLYRSTNYGRTWSEMAAIKNAPKSDTWRFPVPGQAPHLKSMAIDPRDSNVVYAGVEQGALLKTTDGGKSWADLDEFFDYNQSVYKDLHQVLLRPTNPDQVYITTGLGLFLSLDCGATWQHLTPGNFRIAYPDQLIFSPEDDRLLFMSGAGTIPRFWVGAKSARGTVMISENGGHTWRMPRNGFPEGRANVEAMSLFAYPGGYDLFAGTTAGDVFISADKGETWSRIAAGLPPISKPTHDTLIEGDAYSTVR